MFGLDYKSLAIGAVIGYFVLPRVVSKVAGTLASRKVPAAKSA